MPGDCTQHSGLCARIDDLERRASVTDQQIASMGNEFRRESKINADKIVSINIKLAAFVGGMAVLNAIFQYVF